MGKIGIIDYGMGNLHSVKNALDYLQLKNFVSSEKKELAQADALILPGVGAFPDAMEALYRLELVDFIQQQAMTKPLLGICLGMQLLFQKSYEFTECKGLGFLQGEVCKLQAYENDRHYKIPHMGWNALEFHMPSRLLDDVTEKSYVYFVHSFKVVLQGREDLVAFTDYGEEIPAIVQHGNVYGTQFHPEKSEKVGLTILKNFGGFI